MLITDYFWPRPPAEISQESMDALKRDLSEKKGIVLGDKHQMYVDVWVRQKDRLARLANSKWLAAHAATLARRWGSLSAAFVLLAWLVQWLPAEIIFTLSGISSGIVALVFLFINSSSKDHSNEPD